MKIVRFTAENFKRLSLVEITPTGEVVELLGRNGQGKSSVLDAIDVAIRGLEVAPRKPIKTGAEEARIRLDLGELIVTRTFKRKDDGDMTTSLRVESADGVKKASPQTLLDSMIGALAFDPLEFERMDVRRQFDALRAFVPGVDFDEIARLNREDFERRTAVNRKAKDAKVSAERIRPAQPDENLAMIDTAALIAKLDDAGKVNADIETRKANRERVSGEVASIRQTIAANENDIERLLKEIEERKVVIERLRAKNIEHDREASGKAERLAAAGPLPEPIDTTVIRTQISQAEASNKANAERSNAIKMREMLIAEAKQHEAAAEELTLTMDKREVQKREAIAAAKLPVDGLTFGEGELLFNGEPFSQASDAERLRVSIAMAMAMNPKLRIIRVRDGSLMDDDSMRLLAEMAKAQDFQVWVERVGSGKGVGFVLEDGHLKTGEQHHG